MTSRDEPNGHGESIRAVSPVVGVALLIAITVILAAVIGFVVLQTTDAESAASTDARIDISGDASTGITISHEGGDSIPQNALVIKASGTEVTGSGTLDGSFPFDTGDTISYPGGTDVTSGDRLVVIYDDPNSDRETQLATYQVP